MNFILVLSAYFYKRSKHGLTVSPPKKTLQGERHSPVSDPKVIENYFSAIALRLQQGMRCMLAKKNNQEQAAFMLINRSNLLCSCSFHNLARFKHLTVQIHKRNQVRD